MFKEETGNSIDKTFHNDMSFCCISRNIYEI